MKSRMSLCALLPNPSASNQILGGGLIDIHREGGLSLSIGNQHTLSLLDLLPLQDLPAPAGHG